MADLTPSQSLEVLDGLIRQANIPSWDAYFLSLCRLISSRSKDPNTQLGAVIVGPAHEIRSTGYNSFVRGIDDSHPDRLVRPEKYLWMEHAERNAIYSAARVGTPIEGCIIYVEILPCMNCARAIVQAGIREVVISKERYEQYSSERYSPEFTKVQQLLKEAGVEIRQV